MQPECSAAGDADGPGLFRPVVLRGGEPLATDRWSMQRVDRWIPRYRAESFPDLAVRMTVCAPGGYDPIARGGVIAFEVENRASIEQTLQVGVEGEWRWSRKLVQTGRPLATPNRLSSGAAHAGLALEVGDTAGGAALGLHVEGREARYELAAEDGFSPMEPGDERVAVNGAPLRFRVLGTVHVRAGARARLAIHVGLAAERDGALATAAQLAGIGAASLVRSARLELARLARRSDDVALSELLNRNLVFSYYCGVGRALDDDYLYPVTSRSPLHGATGVFNEREGLLWTLPALTECDPLLARELLLRSFEQYSDRPGHHLRYVDGGILDPSVSLQHLCAYGIALDRYVAATEDATVLDEPVVQDTLRDLDDIIFARLHPDIFLGRSDVLASGARADQPYVTYDNVLLWLFVRALERIWSFKEPPRLSNAADEIASAIWSRCTVDIDGAHVLACSTDLERDATVYDDPAGSLRLLPHFEFCPVDDPVWTETMSLLRSSRYPLWLGDRPFPGHAERHAPGHVALAGICADLLADRSADAQALLQRLDLTGGVACDAFDPDTGRATRGHHAAAAAGFLAWALTRALRIRRPMRSAVRRAS